MEIKEVKNNEVDTNEVKVKKITKKQQVLNLMSKPMGVKLSTLVDNLGWQKHTILGFISNLRKQGFKITSSKGTNGTIYKLDQTNIRQNNLEQTSLEQTSLTQNNLKNTEKLNIQE